MRKLMNRALSAYAQSDIDLQLRARFFFFVCIAVLALIFALAIISSIIHHVGTGQVNMGIFGLLVASFVGVMVTLVLLLRGRFFLSAHLIVILLLSTVWTVMIVDYSHPVVRLDSIIYTIVILGFLPLIIKKYRSVVYLYALLNLIFLFAFVYFNRTQLDIPAYVMADFLNDSTLAIIISAFIAASVFAINETALKRAKAEIEDRKQAETTVQSQKAELEIINKELSAALDQMAATTRELEEANAQLKDAQEEILSKNIQLTESEEKFSKAFHLSPLLISLIELPGGRFVDISNSFSAALEYDREDILGRTYQDLNFWTTDKDMKKIREMIQSRSNIHDMEIGIRTQSGQLLTLLISSELISIGQTPHLIMVATDITERIQAENEKEALKAQLHQAQKMEAIGHLAGGVAHDFNNMLLVVLGTTELIMLQEDLDASTRRQLSTIMETANRSANLVRQLLAFARKQPIAPEIIDINRTISNMLEMLRRLIGENIALNWIPGDAVRKISIDPSQIDQMLTNLIVNARDAIDSKGTVTIETHPIALDEGYCATHAGFIPGDYTMLAVSDDGCGMDRATQEMIFDPFFSTKPTGKGTGLGLATIYGIVKQNKGFINVYSEPGRGTTFRIYLPVGESEGDTPVLTDAASTDTLPGGSETILMVEDDPAILIFAETVLRQHLGYTVYTANTPEEAIKLVESGRNRIDLLIVDVVMPGMNGPDLAERLQADIPGMKCLFISGYTANTISNTKLLDNGKVFLPKPFSIKELAQKVRATLSR